jgi:hypothetical protein
MTKLHFASRCLQDARIEAEASTAGLDIVGWTLLENP